MVNGSRLGSRPKPHKYQWKIYRKRYFEACGKVQEVRLAEPKQNIRKEFKFGFVYFYEPEAVQRAIKDLDQTQVGGRIISVRKYIPRLE
jgi:RNA recognition motif-containing protein